MSLEWQCSRLGQPCAVRFLLARGSSPALTHRSDGRKLVAGRVGSRQPRAAGRPASVSRDNGSSAPIEFVVDPKPDDIVSYPAVDRSYSRGSRRTARRI